MIIHFIVNDVAYMDYKNLTAVWGWEPDDNRIGGTEESVVKWAEELRKRGHQVVVYRNGTNREFNGAQYMDSKGYEPDDSADVYINIKSSHVKPKNKPMLYLTNETDASDVDLSMYSGVIWPSQWAVDNIPVNNKTFILPHGYDSSKIYPQEKVKLQCLYASSPDRGLTTLEQIWPSIADIYPEAHLYVSYGAKVGMPNTTSGEFSEEEMNHLYNTSDIWVHPCSGGELFGISGIKAQAAGAIPVYFPTMALAETVKSGVACSDPRDMYMTLLELMGNDEKREEIRKHMATIHYPDWSDSTDRLLEIINEVVK